MGTRKADFPQRSVDVIDNAPYDNKQKEKMPTYSTRNEGMKQWLRHQNIDFDDQLKPEIYEIVKYHKPRYKL